MTDSTTPISKLANSLVRFSATATMFGLGQVASAMTRPVNVLRAIRPIGDALDSVSDKLTHPRFPAASKASTRAAEQASAAEEVVEEAVASAANEVEEIREVIETKAVETDAAATTDSVATESRPAKHQPARTRKGKK
jgi:hypothetical protein